MALSEQELDYLEEFLLSGATSDQCMDIVCLDGFLTALAIGPEKVDIKTWLPVIWGDSVSPAFESAEQGTLIETLITRRFEEICEQFAQDPEGYCPTLYECEIDGKQVFSLEEWCAGFMQAIEHQSGLWQSLFESEYHRFLFPFIFFGTENATDYLENVEDDHAEFMEKLVGSLVPSLGIIYAFWHDKAPEISTSFTFSKEITLEGSFSYTQQAAIAFEEMPETCPCGSGRSYKTCCGSQSKLH